MQDEGEAAPAASGGRHARLQTVKRVAVEETRRYVVAFLYIWLLLAMFTMHEQIALRTRGIVPFAPHGFALVNALVLAKVALVVEQLRLGARIKPHPLIWPIVIEAFLLAVLFIAMHVLESVVSGMLHGQALAASVPAVGGGGSLGLAFAAASFFVAMIPFCAFNQVTTAIGPARMRRILFGSPMPGGGEGR